MQDIADKLIAFGHGFPHVTMNMKLLPDPVVFDTQNQNYIESIFFIGFIPLVLLLLLMVCLMVYYCVIRFSNDDKGTGYSHLNSRSDSWPFGPYIIIAYMYFLPRK